MTFAQNGAFFSCLRAVDVLSVCLRTDELVLKIPLLMHPAISIVSLPPLNFGK